jgi:hypothetical protein
MIKAMTICLRVSHHDWHLWSLPELEVVDCKSDECSGILDENKGKEKGYHVSREYPYTIQLTYILTSCSWMRTGVQLFTNQKALNHLEVLFIRASAFGNLISITRQICGGPGLFVRSVWPALFRPCLSSACPQPVTWANFWVGTQELLS